MIPYISADVISVFGLHIRVWGFFVALGFLTGTFLAARRARLHGLRADVVWDMAFWMLFAGLIGARLFHVFAYDSVPWLMEPLRILDPREPGFAIFGGFIGGGLVLWRYASTHGLDIVAYADAFAWGVPWGCGIGRIGCFLIHDHPGTLTNFILGVRYPDGFVRHDLGLYLSMVGFVTGILFILLNRRVRAKGFWIGLLILVESVSRLLLDTLRVWDARWFGWTPTQILAVPLTFMGVWLMIRWRRAHMLSY